ncbi:MAG: Uma2 family endonuclease [Gammaproteobacteria bacterium]
MSTAITLPRHKLTVTDYHRMIASGILTGDVRVELIEGDLIEMAPARPEHADIIDYISETIRTQTKLKLRVQHPITLPEHSEPEPDIALVRSRRYFNAHPYPADVLMIIEVADTSLDKDKNVKLPLYAWFRIPEVWIVDMQGRAVECFWHPLIEAELAKYVHSKRVASGLLTAGTIPDVALNLDELWVRD